MFTEAPTEGFYDIIYKRIPIKDSKGIEVIPNLIIKLVKISSDNSGSSDVEIFTATSLINFAPPEVLDDFKKSNNLAKDYGLSAKNSFVFNSPYVDGFNARHTCLYFTIYRKEKYGVFICVDSTEEIFKMIKQEITSFIKSIKID